MGKIPQTPYSFAEPLGKDPEAIYLFAEPSEKDPEAIYLLDEPPGKDPEAIYPLDETLGISQSSGRIEEKQSYREFHFLQWEPLVKANSSTASAYSIPTQWGRAAAKLN